MNVSVSSEEVRSEVSPLAINYLFGRTLQVLSQGLGWRPGLILRGTIFTEPMGGAQLITHLEHLTINSTYFEIIS